MISTTLICYNRLEYTRLTIESYLATISVPHELIVVDNASTDGTQKYLQKLVQQNKIHRLILNSKNMFPGHATNQGWDASKGEYLHRSDNDLLYKKGWDKEAMQAFKDFPKMGQLGLLNELYQIPPSQYEEHTKLVKKGKTTLMYAPNPFKTIGGPCIVPREIFKKVRWKDDDKWVGSNNEDHYFSMAIKELDYEMYELYSEKVIHLGYGDIKKYFDYYFETHGRRNAFNWFAYRLKLQRDGKIKNGKTTD